MRAWFWKTLAAYFAWRAERTQDLGDINRARARACMKRARKAKNFLT